MFGYRLHANATAQGEDDVGLFDLFFDLVQVFPFALPLDGDIRDRFLTAIQVWQVMRSDAAVMAASRAPPAKQTVTQVPQPTTSTFSAFTNQGFDFFQ